MSDFLSINRAAFEQHGLGSFLDENTEDKFARLCAIMQEKNEQMNVTAITDCDGVARKHFCDCVFLSTLLRDEGTLCDVGCGGGFPCLPIAITRPGISITAIDSTAKKVAYVSDCARELGLDSLSTVAMRAEDGAHDPAYRERYDVVTARAVASLSILCELCLPYVKIGGRFLAMKGKGAREELDAAKNAISKLGGAFVSVHEFPLYADGEAQTRYIIEIEKTAHTQDLYPRQYAKIKKKPL